MKLLLTSSGLTNKSITNALFELVGKKPKDTNLVFIPTAANVEVGDKNWFITDLVNIQKQNFKEVDIADISAVGKNIWLPKLERADVLFFEGGNTYHLMRWLNKSGLTELLPKLLETRVYVGLSAGSMVASKDLVLKISQIIYGEDLAETEVLAGLNFVDFYFLPHLNSEWFPNVNKENVERAANNLKGVVYALDDNCALKIVNNKVEIISEGEWVVFNK